MNTVIFGKQVLERACVFIADCGGDVYLESKSEKAVRVVAKALDAHDDLLAACELALSAFENNNAIDWGVLEKAIAKAKGAE